MPWSNAIWHVGVYSINKLPLIHPSSCDKSRKRSKRVKTSSSDLIDRSFRRRHILWISYLIEDYFKWLAFERHLISSSIDLVSRKLLQRTRANDLAAYSVMTRKTSQTLWEVVESWRRQTILVCTGSLFDCLYLTLDYGYMLTRSSNIEQDV